MRALWIEIGNSLRLRSGTPSRPVRALWIEILIFVKFLKHMQPSRPVRALWIEIGSQLIYLGDYRSRPVRALWIEIAIQTLRYYLIRCRGP